MNKRVSYGVFVIVIFGALGILTVLKMPEKNTGEGNIFCTADAMMCSDGSYVGRTGPKCEFSECSEARSGGSVTGQVTLSPACPVERNPPDPKCAPKAFVTTVTAFLNRTGDVVGEFETNSNGEYFLDLPIGNYVIRAKGGQVLPRCENKEVTITENADLVVDISCDTGIR